MISFEFSQQEQSIQPHLEKEEKLLWIGIPKQGILFSWFDIFLIPFSLAWGGFAIFWEYMALQIVSEGEPFFEYIFPIVGIPFVIIGFQLMIGRFFSDKRRRANTIYALTNQRVLFQQKEEIWYYKLEDIKNINVSERKDGSGTIFFSDVYSPVLNIETINWPSRKKQKPQPTSFDKIQEVRVVYEKILKAQSNKIP
ncbi:MAG: hypothetical protein NT150_13680 [Bacteroidetes bacterium]|nr:hypothetical protein [Bacteroidota bacterium]